MGSCPIWGISEGSHAMVVHVTRQGSKVHKDGRTLVIHSDDESDAKQVLFVHKLQQLCLYGNVSVTPSAMRLLMREGIDTVFMRLDGRYVGRLSGGEGRNVFLRRRQFRCCDDSDFCLKIARSIVQGKISNQITILQRLKRSRKLDMLEKPVAQIKENLTELSKAQSVDQVRGYEGYASAVYFKALQHAFPQELGFRRRVRRPPTDPVNSVLSLLYTFLINRTYAAVRQAGLDPYPGFLHALEYGRHSLPLDLTEEFRAVLADTLTLSLFGLKVLKPDDFFVQQPDLPQVNETVNTDLDKACHDPIGTYSGESVDTAESDREEMFDIPEQHLSSPDESEARQGKGAVRLHNGAFKKVVSAFEKKLQTEFFHPMAEKRVTYAEALVVQAQHLRQVIEGEADTYIPLVMK
jgi:CRISPR-associated protein Cas1